MPHYTHYLERVFKGKHWKLLETPDSFCVEEDHHCYLIEFQRNLLRRYRSPPSYELKRVLEELGFRHKVKTTNPQLLQLYRRAQRGLLSYETIPTKELKTFARQRGLVPLPGKVSRSAVQQQLEQADDDAVFRFSDLTTELQLMILEFHFASFPTAPMPPRAKPAPVAYASRLTRQLSLPLFYQLSSFTLDLYAPRLSRWTWIREPSASFTGAFWQDATDDTFCRISKLHIAIYDGQGKSTHPGLGSLGVYLDADLSNGGSVAVACKGWMQSFGGPDDPRLEKVRVELSVTVKRIAAREGARKLQRHDLKMLCEAVDRATTYENDA